MDPDLVAAGYDRVADRYASLESSEAEWPRLRRLRKLLAEVPPGGSVLDVGCGAGEALAVISEQHRATGIDVSAAQLERARRSAPKARFVHGDVRQEELGGPFDAVVAFYVVDHVPRTEHASLFRTFHDLLAPGGRGFGRCAVSRLRRRWPTSSPRTSSRTACTSRSTAPCGAWSSSST